MINEVTGAEKPLIDIEDPEFIYFILPTMSSLIFQSTESGSQTWSEGETSYQQTGNSQTDRVYTDLQVENEVGQELEILQSLTGLTWTQLADIFGVQTRSIHYWKSGEKTISDLHLEILRSLLNVLAVQNIPVFQLRNFFSEHVLTSRRCLKSIHSLNFEFLEDWLAQYRSNNKKLPVDKQFLDSRLPKVGTLFSDINEPDITVKYPKSKLIKPLRKPKKQ